MGRTDMIWWICVTSLEEAENFNDFGGGIIIHWQRQELAVNDENSSTRQSCIPGLGYLPYHLILNQCRV